MPAQQRCDQRDERERVCHGDHADEHKGDRSTTPHLLETMPRQRPGEHQQQRRLGNHRDQPDPPRSPMSVQPAPRLTPASVAWSRSRGGRQTLPVPGFDLLLMHIGRAHLTIVNDPPARARIAGSHSSFSVTAGARAIRRCGDRAVAVPRRRAGRSGFRTAEASCGNAAGIWVVDPAFMLELVTSSSKPARPRPPARRPTSPAGGSTTTSFATPPKTSTAAPSLGRHAEATRSNLGHDIRAGLIQPTEAQLHALRQILWRLLVRDYGQVHRRRRRLDRPRAPAPRGRHWRQRAPPARRDHRRRARARARRPWPAAGHRPAERPLGGRVRARPAGVTCTKALGTERMARKLRDAPPVGDQLALRLRTSARSARRVH